MIDLNEDRTLYDLCRKYKYYYTAIQELRKVNGKYWNKHLQLALEEAEDNLTDVTDEITYNILHKYIGYFEIEHDCNYPYPNFKTTIHGEDFAHLIRFISNEQCKRLNG